MSDEFANWSELTRLWQVESSAVSIADFDAAARRQRRQMLALAAAEAGGLVLAFIAAVFIAVHTALIAMSGICFVFFGVCGYLQHRMRKEPPPSGGEDLLKSLDVRMAHEDWNLAQLGIGRAVTLITLVAVVMVGANDLRFFAMTPASHLWALLGITLIVLTILAWNLLLTRRARRRKARFQNYSLRLRAGPEHKADNAA